ALLVVLIAILFSYVSRKEVSSELGKSASKAVERAREVKGELGLTPPPPAPDAGPSEGTILRVITEPAGASIQIEDSDKKCKSPCTLSGLGTDKPVLVDILLAGYKPRTESIQLFKNEDVKELMVSLDREVGSLAIDSDPPGALVFWDQRQL